MKQFYLLETVDPIIISSNNSSTNDHECLDYVPGSAILGLVASQLYSEVTSDQSWNLFHDGLCQFGPCYPMADNRMSLPLPASWHATKHHPAIVDDKLDTNILTNHAGSDFQRDPGTQYKQCRSGFMNPLGVIAKVKQSSVTKTAIDRTTGKAKDAQLFSYSFIEAGQRFIGWFDADTPEHKSLIFKAIEGQHRLGRSRNSEFGRVNVSLLNEACLLDTPQEVNTNRLVLWCLSDLEVLDCKGIPTYTPKAQDIHPKLVGSLNTEQSFILTNKVSRFNQTRQGYDSEQLLIEKGSVLVYNFEGSVSQNTLSDIAHQGIGINKQQGLGWVLANPLWAGINNFSDMDGAQTEALFNSPVVEINKPVSNVSMATPENSSLIAWVSGQQTQVTEQAKEKLRVHSLLQQISTAYSDARAYNNVRLQHEAGPSSTQWRRISDIIKNDESTWLKSTFDGDGAICKAKNDEYGWGIQFVTSTSSKRTNFADHLRSIIENENLLTLRLMLEKLSRYDLSVYQDHKKFKDRVLSEFDMPANLSSGGQA